MSLYPLKFHPIFIDKLWGGKRLKEVLEKDCSEICGESWEISAVKDHVSVVSNGALNGQNLQNLINQYQGRLVGEKVYQTYGEEFPLLIKFLDANDDLSVQVHPNDEQAMEKHGTRGKTEMWYIMDADPGATLIAGLRPSIDKEKYQELFNQGEIMEALNVVDVEPGDTFFVPAGKVHTVGKGIMLAEVQETSDITYRIYDFDRIDINGDKRELHIEEALSVINFNEEGDVKVKYDRSSSKENLVTCKHFTTNRLLIDQPTDKDYKDKDSFIIYICTQGGFSVKSGDTTVELKKGESVLIPAEIKTVQLDPAQPSELLEVYID